MHAFTRLPVVLILTDRIVDDAGLFPLRRRNSTWLPRYFWPLLPPKKAPAQTKSSTSLLSVIRTLC
jgi:hypothetical protein